jgi:hypothetical protein
MFFIMEAGIGGFTIGSASSLYATLAWSSLAGLFSFRLLEKFRDVLDAIVPAKQPGGQEPPQSSIAGLAVPPSRDLGDKPSRKPAPDVVRES